MDYASAKAQSIQEKEGLLYLSSEITSALECTLIVQGVTEDNPKLYLKAEQE